MSTLARLSECFARQWAQEAYFTETSALTVLFKDTARIVAELPNCIQEHPYPGLRTRLVDALAAFAISFTKCARLKHPSIIDECDAWIPMKTGCRAPEAFLLLGEAVGGMLRMGHTSIDTHAALLDTWRRFLNVAGVCGVQVDEVVRCALAQVLETATLEAQTSRLVDSSARVEERLPGKLSIDFIERRRFGEKRFVLLRSGGVNIGDWVCDNAGDDHCYRFHDVFHMAYAVFLNWSPVMRQVLRCRRVSSPKGVEEDGPRGVLVEEAVTAIVFARARELNMFEGHRSLEPELLRHIQMYVAGCEVDVIPARLWNVAVLRGYDVFRELVRNRGGTVTWDTDEGHFRYSAPTSAEAFS